ncbi:hypothetical protein G4G27_22110 [Sphingomonas sp. So64.6b]|uniref:hypothetical protein n=1 Tax=Sphingomonas sp. So64.6b TaxID=2997354 RepID=UPI001604930D|nr:hypothetical protein [Sphingomonas sp. So64.6b]QNA86373.1 hypothetical protein G4G27_22110 [Sphingomonas sp. So64.6b]
MPKPLAYALLVAAAFSPGFASAQVRDAAIVTSGSEPAVKIGKTIVSRPFGAELIDRLSIIGTYPAAGERFYLVRGDGGSDCPARYVVIVSRGDGNPHPTEPFGTCSADARATIVGGRLQVTMTGAAGAPAARFAYADGAMHLLAGRRGGRSIAAARAVPVDTPVCRSAAGVGADEQAATIADFQQSYPEQYRKISSLNRADISPADLQSLVVGLACLATWPGAQEIVPTLATPLFASKRHGAAAFNTLDTVSLDGLSGVNMRAATRLFGAEMSYRVARRGPL